VSHPSRGKNVYIAALELHRQNVEKDEIKARLHVSPTALKRWIQAFEDGRQRTKRNASYPNKFLGRVLDQTSFCTLFGALS